MSDPLPAYDRRALLAGAAALVVVAALYPALADVAARPLAIFVLPGLLTAVLGRWRPTLAVGAASLAVAVVLGVAGPLGPAALFARWAIIAAGVVMGAIGAAVRQHQAGRLVDLDETVVLMRAFELGLAPTPKPPPGFVVAAHYRPAESRLHIGGDFYDAVRLDDGRLAFLIGDVCGHGPREAAVGAALRAGWKSIALGDGKDPADWVGALHRAFFRDGRIQTFVTVCTGVLDPVGQVGRVVSAGHPAPVVLRHPCRPLDLRPGPPLGLDLAESWTSTEIPWRQEPLLLYTDGLVENPRSYGPAHRWGVNGLLAFLDEQPANVDPAVLLGNLLTAATTGRELRDDIAVLVVAAER